MTTTLDEQVREICKRARRAARLLAPRSTKDKNAALEAIANKERLAEYPFYPAAFADFELRLGMKERALTHFEDALRLSRNRAEARFFELRIAACK